MLDELNDPGTEAAGERGDAAGSAADALTIGKAVVRFGTSSWTDPTLLAEGVFYPPEAHTPETRLRYYASRFSVVEVDSSYYALPSKRNSEIWLERTPAHFAFDIKAHALMTGQPSEVTRLPADLKKSLPKAVAEKARVYAKDLEPELRKEIWQRFREAVEPLHAAGKLGAVMLQYPRWFSPGERSRAELAEAAERLDGLPCAVEFRSALWFVPPIVAATSKRLAVIRLHGRNAEAWEKTGIPVVERFRYLYSEKELAEWAPRILQVAEKAEHVHVLMNNCYGNYGTTNAAELAALVRRAYAKG
jgi:uncharacterized protein YecE (DUF72 family)